MRCIKCEDSFPSEETLEEHVMNCEVELNYTCDICNTEFTEQFIFFEHLKAHYEVSYLPTISDHEPAAILVDAASNSGPSQTTSGPTLQVTNDEEEEEVIAASKIDKKKKAIVQSTAPNEMLLEDEFEEDDEFEGEEDLIPAKVSKKEKTAEQRPQEIVLKCSECDRIFHHRNSLVYHMRSHTGERPHQCQVCSKNFFATSALKVHMRLHSGEKPYRCEHCGRDFRQWGDLKYHVISIHSDIRQYQCEFCGKDFARKYSLIVHRRIHTGERDYKCEFCAKCFRAASYLQNHRRIHTGEKPHACSICGKAFRVRSDMKRHVASHTRGKKYSETNVFKVEIPAADQRTSHSLQPGTTVVTVNATANQSIAVGSQMSQQIFQTVREGGQTFKVPVSTVHHYPTFQDSKEAILSGNIGEGTPINIILSQDGCGTEDGPLSATTVETFQAADLPDGAIYLNRDGQMQAVTIRESTTGTLYVWPVYMN